MRSSTCGHDLSIDTTSNDRSTNGTMRIEEGVNREKKITNPTNRIPFAAVGKSGVKSGAFPAHLFIDLGHNECLVISVLIPQK